MELESKVVEINALHQEVIGSIKMTIAKAIEIGKLLSECKKEIGWGKWMTWVEANQESLGFGYMTAHRYINVYELRDDPRFNTVLNLTEIYFPDRAEQVPEDELPEEPGIEIEEEPPAKLQPVEPIMGEPEEPEVEEPEELADEQDELVEDIKDIFQRLDWPHKHQIIDWLLEQGKPQRKAA